MDSLPNQPTTSQEVTSRASSDAGSPVREENFIDAILTQVDDDNIDDIIKTQKKALLRLEKTNEMLINCVDLSAKRFERVNTDIQAHKDLITGAKDDLEWVFRKLKEMKKTLAERYPEIYKTAESEFNPPNEEDEDQ